MNPLRRRSGVVTLFAAVTAMSLVASACGGGGGDAAAGTSVASTTTIEAETTSSAPASTTEPESGETTTTVEEVPADPVMPLTGEPIVDEALAARPALVVKIDNGPAARPQTGLNAADIVYEENVEQITRFAAVFHSAVADPVGPIRSGRTQDVELLESLNAPLFAWSGGNAGVTAAVRASSLRDVGALSNNAGGGYYRMSGRRAPHNLYAQGSMLMALAPADAGPPPQQFQYREFGTAALGGEGSDGARVSMDGVRVQWDWNEQFRLYVRQQNNNPHLLEGGDQVNARNVVVLFVEYRPSQADPRSPEARTVGNGEAWVFTGGSVVKGTWSRSAASEPMALTTPDGAPIELEPGRTWVELARVGKAAVVPTGADPTSIPFP